jgi:hypothetical protein
VNRSSNLPALWGAVAVALAVANVPLIACSSKPTDEPAESWNLIQIRDEARAGQTLDGPGLPATEVVAPIGQPISQRSPPWADDALLENNEHDGLVIDACFVEGQPAAYVTTEVWYNYGPIWLQPEYLLVTAYDASSPFKNVLPGTSLIFGVGASSSFYSPFWQLIFAVVPPNTAPDTYKSVKDILDAKLELHNGPLKLCVATPPGIGFAVEEGGTAQRPFNAGPVADLWPNNAWQDGVKVPLLDFGNDRFQVDDYGVVQATPLFHWAKRNASGDLQPVHLPSVGGVGPLFSGQAAVAPGGKPRFGTLWSIFQVEVPSSAGVFVPDGNDALRALVQSDGLNAPQVDPTIAARADVNDYVMRVALSPQCFSDPTQFPQGCNWLDSQAAIEGNLDSSTIHSTEIVADCPLVSYFNKPVPYP